MSQNAMDRAAFTERMNLWKPLKAVLLNALGREGCARWLEKAAEQVRREKPKAGG